MPTPYSRHREIWFASSDERGKDRGDEPKNRFADHPHRQSHRDACSGTHLHKCHSSRHVLMRYIATNAAR